MTKQKKPQTKTLSAADLMNSVGREAYEIESLGGQVYFRDLSATEALEFSETARKVRDAEDGSDQQKRLVQEQNKYLAMSLCDADGNRLFEEDQAQNLSSMSFKAYMELQNAFNDHLGFADLTEEAAGND